MTDADLYALCIEQEAGGEPYEGKVAVARVIANRTALHYSSDGTTAGTITWPNQFSWLYFAGQPYVRVAWTVAEALARAEALLPAAQASAVWADCQRAVADGAIGSAFTGGPQWDKLNAEPRTLLYLNPDIVHPLPSWASDEAMVAVIYHHTFYRG